MDFFEKLYKKIFWKIFNTFKPKGFGFLRYENFLNVFKFYESNFKNAPLDFSLDLFLLTKTNKIKTVDVFFHKRKHGEAKGGGTMKGKWKLIKRTISYINKLSRKQL